MIRKVKVFSREWNEMVDPYSRIFLSVDADKRLVDYIASKDLDVVLMYSEGIVEEAVANHPDIFLCRLGYNDINGNAILYKADYHDFDTRKGPCGYPEDVAFNAVCTSRYFIHNLNYTDPGLLERARGVWTVDLIGCRQGYTKCNTVVVDRESLITGDEGIAKACQKAEDLNVLLVRPGHVELPGHDMGFIGGASGRIGNEIIFNGDLSSHPDFEKIRKFIEDRGLTCKWFPEYPLTDIGTIM